MSFKEEKFGMTLLDWAVQNDRYFSARALLLEGADPNARCIPTNTPFLEAADKKETANYLTLLLKFGGRVNDVCADSEFDVTPLKRASQSYLESVKILVEAGADINFNTDGYSTALSWALFAGKFQIAEYLISKGADYEKPIHYDRGTFMYPMNILRQKIDEPDSNDNKARDRIKKYIEAISGDTLTKRGAQY